MNNYCAAATADPSYVKALADKGFTKQDTITYAGKVYGHDDIADMVHGSYVHHRPEFARVMGGKKRVNRKIERHFHRTVQNNVRSSFGISPITVILGILVLIFSGPLGLVIAIICCLFEYEFTKDLDEDQTLLSAVGE